MTKKEYFDKNSISKNEYHCIKWVCIFCKNSNCNKLLFLDIDEGYEIGGDMLIDGICETCFVGKEQENE